MNVSPADNIQEALSKSDNLVLSEGIYRLRTHGLNRVTLSKPPTIRGAGARKTIIIGSEDVRSDSLWVKKGAIYAYNYPVAITVTKFGGEVGYENADHTIDLIANNKPLPHVTDVSKVDYPAFSYTRDSFETRQILVNFIPSDFESLELTRCDRGFQAPQPLQGIIIADLSIENFANPAQQGILDFDFCQAHIENVEARYGHGVGVKVGSDSVIRQSWLNDNGQQGFNITGDKDAFTSNVLIEDCRVEGNNFAGFTIGAEAGNKLVFTRDVTIKRSFVANNFGHGIWFDAGNIDYDIVDCTIQDNHASGIYIEISKGGYVRNNFLSGNAKAYRGDDKQARYGQVWVDTSMGTVDNPVLIAENTFTGDCLHLAIRNDNRPDYKLQHVRVETNQFYDGAISSKDIHTGDMNGRNIDFDANMYTPDTKAWVGDKPADIALFDPSGLVIDKPTPITPPYTGLPDLDAVVIPDPKPEPIPTGKQYVIDAIFTVFGVEVGKITGTITDVTEE